VTEPLGGAFPEPKAFRRQFGVAPGAYRKANAETRPG
jgi:AraC-like DNA-binding protein